MIFRTTGAEQIDDFRISLNAEANDLFLEVDGTREQFKIPLSREQVEDALDDQAPNRLATDPLSSFGSTLFSLLFSGKAGRQLWERLGDAEAQNRGLRLRILSSVERVQHLPWELLFDPSRGDFMSLSGRVALVRSRQEGFVEGPTSPIPKLRILAAEADMTGNMLTQKDLDILTRLARDNPDTVVVDTIERATAAALTEKLQSGKYDIFHFAGTGEVLDIRRRGGISQAIRLWGNSYQDPLFDSQRLGELLAEAGVRLAVLNACHTDWVARSLARYLPSTIGIRESLRTEGCVALCESLYPGLVSTLPIDLAVTAVRQALDRRLPGTGQWCKVIFYLQRNDGLFFLDADQPAPWNAPAASSSEPNTDRSSAALLALMKVYERNLSAIERNSKVAFSSSGSETTEGLRQKIDDIRRQLKLPDSGAA